MNEWCSLHYFQEREFLTLVTVSSIPPLTCYGSGATVEVSREEAASNALKPLLQLGLDRTNKLKSFEESQAPLQGNDCTHSVFILHNNDQSLTIRL